MSVIRSSVGAPVAAQANLDDVRRQYYDTLEAGQFWWWIRAMYIDPNELIVDDDEGGLYRVPFSAKGDEVTFSDPIPVKIQYVDQPATTEAAASSLAEMAAAIRASVAASLHSDPVTTFTVRAESRPGGCMTPEEAAALRERFDLTP